MTIFVYDNVTDKVLSKEEVSALRAQRSPAKQTANLRSEVTRGHWRLDRRTGDLLSIDEWYERYPDTSIDLQIVRDIDPYQSAVTKEVIGGRKQHRDHLRARGLVEIGNEQIRRKPLESPGGIANDIIRSAQEMGHWRP